MDLRSVACRDSTLVAVGRDTNTNKPLVVVSTHQGIWTQRNMALMDNFDLFAVEWTGSAFVAMGHAGHVLVSPSGTTWSHHKVDAYQIYGICWDGARLIAVGFGGEVFQSSQAAPDEEGDWTRVFETNRASFIHDMTIGDVGAARRIVAVGDNGTILSTDDEFQTISFHDLGGTHLHGVTSTSLSGKTFIAVGSGGDIFTSPDAETWTRQPNAISQRLYSIDWFVPLPGSSTQPRAITVGANGTIETSENGADWTARTSHTSELLRSVAVGSVRLNKPTPMLIRRVVAVGNNGTILYSSNGTTWSATPSGTTERLYAVAALNAGFLAVGARGTILASNNGIDWTKQASGTSESFSGVAWTGNQVVAVGRFGAIFTSPNGINHWKRRYTPVGGDLEAVMAMDSENLAAIGADEIVLVSESTREFSDWIFAQCPPAGQYGPDDDPNGDGITNLMAYAMNIPAVDPSGPADFARMPRLVDAAPGERVSVAMNPGDSKLPDVAYILETSPDLEPGNWDEVFHYMPGQPCGSGSADVFIDMSTGAAQIVLPETCGAHSRFFIRLRIEQTQ
jgi:hypothetical protein